MKPISDARTCEDGCTYLRERLHVLAGKVAVKIPSVGHGVITATTPGMASQQTSDGEPTASQYSMTPQSLKGILAAGGCEPARRRSEWGDELAIEHDGQHYHPCQCLTESTWFARRFHECGTVNVASSA